MMYAAIDGACKGNGKEDCISAAGVFTVNFKEGEIVDTHTYGSYEFNSTSQRGELHALCVALQIAMTEPISTLLILTDSEYIFNAMTKNWLDRWRKTGWKTSSGEHVKNRDIWIDIYDAYLQCTNKGMEVMLYHTKGHCIPLGAVTAQNSLSSDQSGASLLTLAKAKYDKDREAKAANLNKAIDLSVKNNGFVPDGELLKLWVSLNIVADTTATFYLNKAVEVSRETR